MHLDASFKLSKSKHLLCSTILLQPLEGGVIRAEAEEAAQAQGQSQVTAQMLGVSQVRSSLSSTVLWSSFSFYLLSLFFPPVFSCVFVIHFSVIILVFHFACAVSFLHFVIVVYVLHLTVVVLVLQFV